MKLSSSWLIVIILILNVALASITIEINQDGSADYSTIQAGINSANNADTVLVYPGTYYENLDFESKSIILASIFLLTGNDELISNTIINGSQTGSCIEIRNCNEEYNVIIGFTIKNGSGSFSSPTYHNVIGGGLLIKESTIIISDCIIIDNQASAGGGIYCSNSTIHLAGVDLINNRSYAVGGGLFIIEESYVTFDEENLSNIYLNYSSMGNDIAKSYNNTAVHVVVDTFTVLNPSNSFAFNYDMFSIPMEELSFDIQNAKITPVNHDLYVSTTGDNSNSGLSSDDPLLTINYALASIDADSLANKTIHLADGVYSNSENDQWFPVQLRSYVNLIGESNTGTILDAESRAPLIIDRISDKGYTISDLSLINGNGVWEEGGGALYSTMGLSDFQYNSRFIKLENLNVYNCEGTSSHISLNYLNVRMNNIHISDAYGNANTVQSLTATENEQVGNDILITNSSLKRSDTDGFCFLVGQMQDEYSRVTLINCEFSDITNTDVEWIRAHSGIVIQGMRKADIINCTIGNNHSLAPNGGTIGIHEAGSIVNFYNTILYGNNPKNIWLENDFSDNPVTVNFHNSLVEGGDASIHIVNNWDTVNWLEGNIDEAPLWDIFGEYPYSLRDISPCIDAGTMELPVGIEMPEYDLAGNPRIVGSSIDMGAYEYQDSVAVNEETLPVVTETAISNYPNPFNPATTIKFDLLQSGKVELSIYNIKGQKVKTLMDAYSAKGSFNLVWNGKDNSGKQVASGNYMAKCTLNGKEIATTKMTLLK